jgi:hypothetical protein
VCFARLRLKQALNSAQTVAKLPMRQQMRQQASERHGAVQPRLARTIPKHKTCQNLMMLVLYVYTVFLCIK